MIRRALLLLGLPAAARAATVTVEVHNRGDDSAVPQAEIVLPDGTIALTDERGRWTLDAPDGEPVTLTIQSPVHLPQTITLTPPLERPLHVWLLAAPVPGEIVVEAFRPRTDTSRHHVDAEQAYETPGTYDDAVRLVQALPGVNVQREFSPSSGEVTVRGSLPGDSRYYYDGIEVPYLYHFNQYASVFPASQLDSLELYPSTFSARYGDATGAIIEATSKAGRPDKVHGNVGINLVTVGADVRAPLPKQWTLSVAARRSFHDLLGRNSTQYPLWPRFYDFSVRADHDADHTSTSVFATGAGDRYDRAVGELDVLDPVDQLRAPALTYGRDYQMLGVRHVWGRGRIVSAVVHDAQDAEVNVGGSQAVRTLGLPTRLDVTLPRGERFAWELGAELRPDLTWIDVTSAGTFGPLVTREAPAMAWRWDATRDAVPRLRAGAYATLNAAMGPLRLMPGVRVGLDSIGWKPTFEPRLSGRVRLAEQTELRFATGRYQQRPETLQLLYDRTLPTTDGWQASVGLDQAIAGRLELSLDGYYKAQRDVLFQPFADPIRVWPMSEAWGGELTARYRLRETFFLWGWFAAGRSFVREDGVATPTAADQPLAGGVVASWNILPQLNVALRYRAASGLPYTGIDGSVYDATADTWLPRYQSTNGLRFPTYHKIDVHAAYTFRFNRWSLAMALDLWIVPKSSAQLYPTWSYDYSEQGFVIGPTFVPLMGLRASF
ncbi:MAG TPA: TonB-dependent receptor plug domain-containing protein [Myxococcota bacterium]|nr:TonB-dependent receptor plug domain-containing protein [Myxococcota bacterium]